jgi:hypothetical protein
MKVIVPLLVLIAVSVLAMLEANIKGDIGLWGLVFRSIGWLAIAGVLILVYEKTGTRKLVYPSILMLTILGFSFVIIGILMLFINGLYLLSIPLIIIGVVWVWFILSRYKKYKET